MCHSCYSSGAHALSIRHYVIVSCVALLLAFACPAGASGGASTPDQVAVKEAEEAPTTLPAVDPTEDHAADSSIDASKRARSERSKRQSSGIPQRQRSSVAAPRTSVVEQLEKSTRPRSKKGKPLQYALLALELSIYAFVVYFTYTQLDCHFNKKCRLRSVRRLVASSSSQ
ncbi:putative transmembrane protein [Toxoplasma gondii RUB]|uniref:Transmembrane protein n=7 Tax=Toxoplasma gondii TaxID=5811 RepID=V4ZD84_TOXGV|nr:putative transmembrane protein [Toxoplasma gondii VEG]KFG35591.1 putative transmembrane protein [Toxoplasma gondii GAB2-2007-GAL-DOM2]KFG60049.1 putative transmembrane protein [Toxoplasma gondii RUB]KFH06577.1 putative transmembrane protein [Toxoplasma gondii VAND]KFH14970.1 putative transmembrane protein [Toxoplasma gondii MAS]PUA89058.1 putative transmembrane protein [Toxoplasma gondii TgCATBr9]RQX68627.1 putative transmembrane protein [Toxoplasma gondii CAST]